MGHWENDTGFWIVINDLGDPFDVIRSGDPRPEELETISLSPDCRILVCRDKRQTRYTLTLANKYEAQLEWYDLKAKSVWRTEAVHELTRATEEQRRVTQQDNTSRPEP